PWYLRSGVASPRVENWKISLLRPMRVGPLITTWEWMMQSSPISTPAPIQVQGPTWTLRPSRASGSILASGSIIASGRLQRAEDGGFTHQQIIHPGSAHKAPQITLAGIDLGAEHQSVAGDHRPLEARAVDAGEQIQTLIAGLLVDRGKTQHAGRLGHRFDDQHPRENGLDGEMA